MISGPWDYRCRKDLNSMRDYSYMYAPCILVYGLYYLATCIY